MLGEYGEIERLAEDDNLKELGGVGDSDKLAEDDVFTPRADEGIDEENAELEKPEEFGFTDEDDEFGGGLEESDGFSGGIDDDNIF